jgi:ABC-type xylose transport system permease subunit
MTSALVFMIVAGELDLAFPSMMGASGGLFVSTCLAGFGILPAARRSGAALARFGVRLSVP